MTSEPQSDFSPTIAEGLVLTTDPEPGATAARGSAVTLVVSKGPKPVATPKLEGLSDADAQAAIAAAGLIYDASKSDGRFDATVGAGVVIASYGIESGTGKRFRLKEGEQYYDQGAVSLRVSLGPLPDVDGQDYDAAAATLTNAQVVVERAPDAFSDDVESGKVISVVPKSGDTVKPGDTVVVTVSKGQDLVALPDNILGSTINDASARLIAAGFKVTIQSDLTSEFWGIERVASMSSDGGEIVDNKAKRESTITIVGNFSGGDDGNNGNGNGN